jgi:hypothetical protein
MTSEELKQKQAADLSTNSWMREMCIQLALLNEKPQILPCGCRNACSGHNPESKVSR